MRLLLDTDVFCKLGVAGLIGPVLGALRVDIGECGRLSALPHMLRRGRLPRIYGQPACDALAPLAAAVEPAPAPSDAWLEALVGAPGIDPGEAQIFAVAAERTLILVSGDKRALRALASIPGYPDALRGRIVTFEAVLITVCAQLGSDAVRAAVQPLVGRDQTLKVCFSPGNPDPVAALWSYFTALKNELHPLVLWVPPEGGAS